MAWASRAGHAITDVNDLSAQFQCDRCGQTWSRKDTQGFQYDFRGPRLFNTQLFICDPCRDKPCVWFKPIVVPADPIPVPNPRPYQTNTGASGWSMGAGWSIGPWSVGSNFVGPAVPTEYAPPQNNTVSVDEE